MQGQVAALYRHPVKGFTPEPVTQAELVAGDRFPCDRLYVVENGPSGFDPAAPAYIPKQKFAVLMAIAEVAKARTRYDEASGVLHASAVGHGELSVDLRQAEGRERFAAWLKPLLGEEAHCELKVLEAPESWRFTDHPLGHVSIINLASLRDLESKIGQPLNPLRFRANIYVDGWPPWAENAWEGRELMVGWAKVKVFKPIVRCAATHVNPDTAERDIDVVKGLFDNYGNLLCGIYVHVTSGGMVGLGDACTAPVDLSRPVDMEAP